MLKQIIRPDNLEELTELHVGWDSEYTSSGPDGWSAISDQLYVLETGEALFKEHIGQRITLRSLIDWLIDLYPALEKVTLVSHFSRAEMSAVSDGRDWLLPKDTGDIQGSSMVIQNTIIGRWKYIPPSLFYGDRKIEIDLWDTFLLLSASLEKLGDLLGLEKLESNGYRESDRMLEWIRQDRISFETYALRDAEIAVKFHRAYCQKIEEAGLTPVKTTGGIFEREAATRIKEDPSRLLYQEKKVWNGRYKELKLQPTKQATQFTDSYYGGRNETYLHGLYPGDSFDYDLIGAYSGVLGMLPCWNPKGHFFSDAEKLYAFAQQDPLALARVQITFEFNDDVIYPSLPVSLNDGLIFPKTGQTDCSLQEFLTAYPRLKDCSAIAWVYPTESESPVVDLVRDLKNRRNLAKEQGDTLGDEIWKLVLNAGYGKFAQGFRNKVGFDTSNTTTNNIVRSKVPPSRISNPAIAAYITGWCRSLIAEFLFWTQDNGVKVACLSTDGFTVLETPLPEEVLSGVGPLTRLMVAKYESPILELKHYDDVGFLALKTRGYAMLGDQRPLVAMAGVQRKSNGGTDQKRAALMLKEWQNLEPFKHTTYPSENLPTITDWIINNRPPETIKNSKSWNYDYDLKRCPINPVEIEGRLQFETRPWRDYSELTNTWLDAYIDFRRGNRKDGAQIGTKNKLVNLEDFRAFEEYVLIKEAGLTSMARLIDRSSARIIANIAYKLEDGLGFKKIAKIMNQPAQTVRYWILKKPMSVRDMMNPVNEKILRDAGVNSELQGSAWASLLTPLELKNFFVDLLTRWKLWTGPKTGVLLEGSASKYPAHGQTRSARVMVVAGSHPQILGPPHD